jgi:cyanate permease
LVSIQNIKNGINIPEYLQIGKTMSYVTAIEYLSWGIFLGLAFLFSSLGIGNKYELKHLKMTLFICSCLCIIGFFGWLIINENLWYIASMGYGIGTVIICIELLLYEKGKDRK